MSSKVKKIVLEIGGKEVEITIDEVRALHMVLGDLLANETPVEGPYDNIWRKLCNEDNPMPINPHNEWWGGKIGNDTKIYLKGGEFVY